MAWKIPSNTTQSNLPWDNLSCVPVFIGPPIPAHILELRVPPKKVSSFVPGSAGYDLAYEMSLEWDSFPSAYGSGSEPLDD